MQDMADYQTDGQSIYQQVEMDCGWLVNNSVVSIEFYTKIKIS